MHLDLRKLAHFVAVVEERSMTAAAVRLRLTQQALSLSIRALEREMGVVLLERGRRGVQLLPAGRSLYTDGVPLLRAASTTVAHAQRAGTELLRIGRTPTVTDVDVVVALAGLPAELQAVVTQVVPVPPGELRDGLWDRSIDLGLSRTPPPGEGVRGVVVARHRLRVAVRSGHRLAARGVVAPADIAAETLVVPALPDASADTALLLGLLRAAGVDPAYRVSRVQGTPPVATVLGTDDVALVTDAPGPAVGGGVRVVDLEPALAVPLVASWRAGSRSRTRDALVGALHG